VVGAPEDPEPPVSGAALEPPPPVEGADEGEGLGLDATTMKGSTRRHENITEIAVFLFI
jgi:hypothetical protein